METRLVNADGSLPSNEQAYYAGQNAWAAVDPTTRRLRVDSIVGSPSTASTFATGTKTVASTGTPEALGTGTYREVFIYPLRTNTAAVYWGITSTNNAQDATLPVVLSPGNGLVNLANIFLDVTVNGEGVRWIGIS